MKTLILITLSFISLYSFSQTDIIEMRSRSASLKKYERFSINSNDHVNSNFGMRAMREVKNAVLDSVVSISDSVAVMYTSEYCTGSYMYLEDPPKFLDSSEQVYSNPRVGKLWKAGGDTVINHPLFSHRHSLDSVKKELDRYYYFNLPADSTEFVGFDNAQESSNIDTIEPVKHKRDNRKNGFGWELIFMIVTPIGFLIGMNRLKFI